MRIRFVIPRYSEGSGRHTEAARSLGVPRDDKWRRFIFLIILLWTSALRADVVLPSYFSDDMVIQRDVKFPVRGWARAGEDVTVTLGDQTKSAKAGADHVWRVELAPLEAGGPFELKIAASGRSIAFNNVLVGDVWFCAGQSNMQFPMEQVIDAPQEIETAKDPQLRLATVPMTLAGKPQDDVPTLRWTTCDPRNIRHFSAVAYYFGREMRKHLNVPIGLIHSSWYGTSINGWTSRGAYESHDLIKPIFDDFVQAVAKDYPDWPDRMGEYHWLNGQDANRYIAELSQWQRDAMAAQQESKPIPPEPKKPISRPFADSSPTGIYNAMVAPLTRYPIKGIVWYQGEADTRVAARYEKHLPIVIEDWRRAWDSPDLPFCFVQIAYCKWWAADWARQCEAQTSVWQNTPNTAMVVINDLHDNYDQHPRLKRGVGERLALAARAIAYGEKEVVYAGPTYKSMKVEGNEIRVTFDYAGGKLESRDVRAFDGFTIAGEDGKFVPAKTTIDGDTIVAKSDAVKSPKSLRYNWGVTNPVCAIYGATGLPMSAFRTDR